jgi:splicing factor U2AF subunit
MIGHVYAKFTEEEEAADALNVMSGRYYDGRRMEVEFSPVTDFREARCRDFDEDTCRRGGFCNFMHIKPVPLCLVRDMEDEAEDGRRREEAERAERRRREERRDRGGDHRRGRRERERKGGRRGRGGSRSRSRSRTRSRSGSRDRGGGGG